MEGHLTRRQQTFPRQGHCQQAQAEKRGSAAGIGNGRRRRGRGCLGNRRPDDRGAFLSCVNQRTGEALTLNLVKNRIAQIYRKRSVAGDKGRGRIVP